MRTFLVALATFFLNLYGCWRVFVPSRQTGGYWTHGIVQPADGVWSPSYLCTPTGVAAFSNMQVEPTPTPQRPFTVRRVTQYDREPGHSAVMKGESWLAADDLFQRGFATGIQNFHGSELILDSGSIVHIVINLKTGHFIREEAGLRADVGYIDWFETPNPSLSLGSCVQVHPP